MTFEETAREVRAQVAWGKGESEIRSILRKKGATASDVDEALRAALSQADASFRRAGFWGVVTGGAMLIAAWALGNDWLHSAAHSTTGGRYRSSDFRPAVALILLGFGTIRLVIGVQRLMGGGRSDRSR